MLRIINTVMTMILTKVIAIPQRKREGGDRENEAGHILRATLSTVNVTGSTKPCIQTHLAGSVLTRCVYWITKSSAAGSGYLNLTEIRPLNSLGGPICVPLNTDWKLYRNSSFVRFCTSN